ncbi:disulfide bond formation protein B [Marivita sp. XM-24bin2]|jgi:disulfide bond formation protein DsbB|uniref:disulfide bond formation protein B n=1 Tax=unclassified Marivita TaxID=2632480 RepID=UPI000D7B86BB|nr:disulfide bond formation protein B [Marivita sp. XM-24bin2]MCR9110996.1 disulfide bond formation protein B [Paracoccaceae bacterium]PWL33842.1 MAG: disulfide bond formation protein B [Marivita sp. XM-24bin2]
MTLNRRMLMLLAAGGSLALMLGALAFQHIGGLPPCKLCIWQRYPHVVAIALGAVALRFGTAVLAWLGALAAFTTAAVGAYHTGVERGWWEGPTTCSSGPIGGLSTDELFDQIMNAPLVRCDEVPWEMFGLSMASWNMVISLVLMALWIAAARKPA